jgi:uncharacterized glyoxalase superfamily protein PhnB
MKLNDLRPMLWTENLSETVDFYTKTLGFSCDEINKDWGWASLSKDEVSLMFAKPNAHTPFEKPIFTGSFYFSVSEVDALWTQLKDKANLAYGIENFEYGMREFAIYNNNGYMLQFGQEIDV